MSRLEALLQQNSIIQLATLQLLVAVPLPGEENKESRSLFNMTYYVRSYLALALFELQISLNEHGHANISTNDFLSGFRALAACGGFQ